MPNEYKEAPKRPVHRTAKLIDRLLTGLAKGRSVTTLCAPSSMPTWATVLHWIGEDEQLSRSFELAAEMGRAYLADTLVDIADEPTPESDKMPDEVAVRWARLRVEARSKVLSNWKPMSFHEMAMLLNPPDARAVALTPSEQLAKDHINQIRKSLLDNLAASHTAPVEAG